MITDTISLTAELIRLSKPHCDAELEDIRPIEHWKDHCVNCGVHMSRSHNRKDCPKQKYELASPKQRKDRT